jgi:hypothetical protein
MLEAPTSQPGSDEALSGYPKCESFSLFSHKPTVFKARAVGDAVGNGTALPTVGYFQED